VNCPALKDRAENNKEKRYFEEKNEI